MRKLVELIIGIFVFSACSSSSNKRDEYIFNNVQTSKTIDKDNSQNDSIRNPNSTPHFDNMRGFDPPSEDDMDDNGMNRYIENNDEEGWY